MKIRFSLFLSFFIGSFLLFSQEATFHGEKVLVRLVEVPVQVTDKEGNPIVKLKKEDFTLWEDGQPQTIAHFYEVQDSRLLRKKFSDELVAKYGVPPSPEYHKRLVIFIDAYNLLPLDWERVKKSISLFLRKILMPGDSVMVVSASPSLSVLLPWSSDLATIDKTLHKAKVSGIGATSSRTQVRNLGYRLQRMRSHTFAMAELRGYVMEKRQEILSLLSGLQATLEMVAEVPGQKYVLWVTPGLPSIPGLEYFYLLERRFPTHSTLVEALQYTLTDHYKNLASFASSHNITLIPLDSRGLILSTPDFDVDLSGLEYLESSDITGAAIAAKDSQDTLETLAEATGGKAIVNTNDFSVALGAIAIQANHHYILGYYPSHPPDGKYHKIKVNVSFEKFRIRHREGYIDWKEGETFPYRLKAVLLWPEYPQGEGLLDIQRGKAKKDGRHYQVPLVILLSPELLGNEKEKNLRVGIIVGDEKGRQSDIFTQDFTLHRKDFQEKQKVALGVKLRMRKGKQTLVVGVDRGGGDTVFLKRTITVPGKE